MVQRGSGARFVTQPSTCVLVTKRANEFYSDGPVQLRVTRTIDLQVIAPSTASMDRVKKMAFYAREGVRHAWLVDPIAQTLEVLQLEAGRWTIIATAAAQDQVRAEPFDALDLNLSLLWD
jgi:Uma2 family endonuclease